MSNSPKNLLTSIIYFVIKVLCSIVVVFISPAPELISGLSAVFIFWTWQLVAHHRRGLVALKAALQRGESVNPLAEWFRNFKLKFGLSIMAALVFPLLGIPGMIVFWIVDLAFLNRQRAAVRAAALST